MTFLPDNYKAPEGNFFKLQDGENTFRIISSAVVGYEYWNSEDKPIRSRKQFVSTPADIKHRDGKPTSIKHFWAFVVYSYRADKRQILEITQGSIQQAIKALVDNKKWGDPKKYDITINRAGSGLETEYQILPNPHTELTLDFPQGDINLEALFTGDDPFAASDKPAVIKDMEATLDTHKPKVAGDEGFMAEPPDFLKAE